MSRRRRKRERIGARWRGVALVVAFALGALALEGRVLYLQLFSQAFLTQQADDRHLRTVQISAHRGTITDRHGEPLAVSTPVDSIWADPRALMNEADRFAELARALGVDRDWLARRVTSNLGREFVYLRRHLPPSRAAEVLELGIPGVSTLREYQRYYPAAEVTGHVIGFTDIDDRGQEGLELAYDYWLASETGEKRVLKDRLGRVIGDVEEIKPARPGRTLRTSLDLRLQYLAYRELKAAVNDSRARAGSVVILDPDTGEVLAMANQPAYNPNDRSQLDVSRYRNRAATDIFEPGSSFKPLVVAAALETGHIEADSVIDTSPGYIEIDGERVTADSHNLGPIDVGTVLARSSNVGAAKIALGMKPAQIYDVLSALGIGQLTESGFPGETAGVLNEPEHWRTVGQATLSYGYGLSVSTLQLARAYAAIAADGVIRPVSLVALDEAPAGRRAVSSRVARALKHMLEGVVSPAGTGERAEIPYYRVAGKTGTAQKSTAGGYSSDRHTAIFAGFAPASDPELVAVVVIDEPQGEDYHGGDAAAPVFRRIVSDALRLMAVPPDDLPGPPASVVAQAEAPR